MKAILPLATWMDLEGIMLSEVSRTEKDTDPGRGSSAFLILEPLLLVVQLPFPEMATSKISTEHIYYVHMYTWRKHLWNYRRDSWNVHHSGYLWRGQRRGTNSGRPFYGPGNALSLNWVLRTRCFVLLLVFRHTQTYKPTHVIMLFSVCKIHLRTQFKKLKSF